MNEAHRTTRKNLKTQDNHTVQPQEIRRRRAGLPFTARNTEKRWASPPNVLGKPEKRAKSSGRAGASRHAAEPAQCWNCLPPSKGHELKEWVGRPRCGVRLDRTRTTFSNGLENMCTGPGGTRAWNTC